MGRYKPGQFKVLESAPDPNFESISMMGFVWELAHHGYLVDMLLTSDIGANYNTFELPRFAKTRYKTRIFKTGNFKTGVAENLGL